eukprot:TRINITY_DN15415_c1_g2_i2.p1 TRINITY_DN15415_c1_g2~~TRINITY_DN15415_c1_g2_i2.p1  ORF type:complete len:497 (-),score=73.98 TRINITY_DN15415_c1_g2_i2:91-1581(-)
MAATRGRERRDDAEPTSWVKDLQEYEKSKRYHIEPDLLKGRTVKMQKGDLAKAERAYDPILCRFRDQAKEDQLLNLEHGVRTHNINRAKDIQLRREAHHDIVTHEYKLEPLQPRHDFMPAQNRRGGSFPTTVVGQNYNIISGIGVDQHHWDHPNHRPYPKERSAKHRMVAAGLHKDFNVLTNRYLKGHEAKAERDKYFSLLEASQKHREKNTFNPVTQRYCEDRVEGRVRACEDARDVEIRLRSEAAEPLTHRGNLTRAYDMVSHQVKDYDLADMFEAAEAERVVRYKTRHMVEDMTRTKDIEFQDALIQGKLDQVAHERHTEASKKGYDLITNQTFGNGRNQKVLFKPLTKPRVDDAWERAMEDYDDVPRSGGHQAPSNGSLSARQPRREATGGSSGSRTRESGLGLNPSDVATMRLPAEGSYNLGSQTDRSSKGRRPGTGGSGATSARSYSSSAARAPTNGVSNRAAAAGGKPPPAPNIPGSPGGSVYSRTLGA